MFFILRTDDESNRRHVCRGILSCLPIACDYEESRNPINLDKKEKTITYTVNTIERAKESGFRFYSVIGCTRPNGLRIAYMERSPPYGQSCGAKTDTRLM